MHTDPATTAAATAAVTMTRRVKFAHVLREVGGMILTDYDVAAVAVHRADMVDRVAATPDGSLLRQSHRVAAAARTIFPGFDDLPATSALRGEIRRVVSAALTAAGPA